MANPPRIAIFAASLAQAEYLAELVRMAGYIPVTGGAAECVLSVRIEGGDLSLVRQDGTARPIKIPMRAEEMITVLQKTMADAHSSPTRFVIGDGFLDVRESLWIREGETALRLTEKEVALLLSLKNASGQAVSRQKLLNEVWAYAQGVETHTLETHIYRLRQKIERDPASPKILLTQEDGYILGA